MIYGILRKFVYVAALVTFFMTDAKAQSGPSVDAAIIVADRWAVLADVAQAASMWEMSDPVMQKNTTKENWGKYLAAVQAQMGHATSHEWAQIVRVINPPDLPPGEYVNVFFIVQYTKASGVEKISLVQMNNHWVPVGYVVTRSDAAPASHK